LQQVPYEHPDVATLEAAAQQFYVQIYGGPDDTPYATADFSPPHGTFFVGYLNGEAVAMGGWRFRTPGVPRAARRPAEIRRMFVRESGSAGSCWLLWRRAPQPPAPTGCCWRLANHRSPRSVSTDPVATSMSNGSDITQPQIRRSISAALWAEPPQGGSGSRTADPPIRECSHAGGPCRVSTGWPVTLAMSSKSLSR